VVLLDAGFTLRSGRHGGKYRMRVSVSGGALEAREVLAAGVTKRWRDSPRLSLAKGATPRL
jgi:hypothetical protein